MRNKYWKYICLLGLGAFCWTCSDDNPNDGPDGPGLSLIHISEPTRPY